MRIAIIGQGYVGLTIASFASDHHDVIGYDLNPAIVDQLNQGVSHIEGVDSAVLGNAISKGAYKATTNGSDFAGAQIVVIAVPTVIELIPAVTPVKLPT